MKKNILIIGLLLIYQLIFAQHFIISHINANHNPNNLNTENEGTYGSVIGWTLLLSGAKSEPIWSPTRTLPFDFEFNGKVFNKFRASSNGIVTFDTTEILPNSKYESFVLPNDSVPDNSIGVLGLETNGVKDLLSVKEIKTFPNPTVNQLNVSFNAEKQDNLHFDLYNLDGQLIKSIQKSVNSGLNTIEINTTDVISGVYYLSIKDSKNNVHSEPITIVK